MRIGCTPTASDSPAENGGEPAMAAITKPNSISWTCQASGSNRLGIVLPVANITIHATAPTPTTAPRRGRTAESRRSGRPARDDVGPCRRRACS
jgi:hypothetical protein